MYSYIKINPNNIYYPCIGFQFKGKRTLEDIEASLKPDFTGEVYYVAPASGLILKAIEFE